MKKTVKKGAVMEEKITEIFINGKNTVAMSNIDQFKRHIGSAFHGIFVTTSGTKVAVKRKGTNLKLPQWVQTYIAPPKEGSPQPNILSIFSISVFLG